ncbi:MAG: hypothetical protein ACI8S6_002779 [Myxococcota bacterium]|jgi:hypothetical protein
MWCLREMGAAFVAQMEHILDLYAQPADPKRPLINFDETHKKLVGEVRAPSRLAQARVTRTEREVTI